MIFFMLGTVLASMVLFVVCVILAEKIKKDEETFPLSIFGGLLVGFITYSAFVIFGS